MSTLVYEELNNFVFYLEQTIKIEKKVNLLAVRLDLFKSKNPDGSIILKVFKDGELIKEKEITLADLHNVNKGNLNPGNYFHGFVLFEFDTPLIINSAGEYKFRLYKGLGYVYSFENHIGWIKQFERRIAPMISEPKDFTESPFGIEFIEQKNI